MREYRVYIVNKSDDKYKIIPQSFNWFAFLFGVLWTLKNRMWFKSLLIFTIGLFSGCISLVISDHFGYDIGMICNLIFATIIGVWVGISAPKWYHTQFNFESYWIVKARNKIDAIWRVASKKRPAVGLF